MPSVNRNAVLISNNEPMSSAVAVLMLVSIADLIDVTCRGLILIKVNSQGGE
jgi:hypothetical protein